MKMSECQRKICGPGIERYETQFAGAVLRDGVQQCRESADKSIKTDRDFILQNGKTGEQPGRKAGALRFFIGAWMGKNPAVVKNTLNIKKSMLHLSLIHI